MANINDSFPSKYLKAADIEGTPTVTIADIAFEAVGKENEIRPILYYEGEAKGIVLNKTNATNISKLYGYETEDWLGKSVMLGATFVDFNGQSVEAIRIYPPKRAAPANARTSVNTPTRQRQPEAEREFAPLPDGGDDIPF